MSTDVSETVCLILMTGYPMLAAILLFHHLKLKRDATQKKGKSAKKVLHSKPRRNKAVKEGESPLPFRDQELPFSNDTTNN